MTDNLAIVEKVIEEHLGIRDRVKRVTDSIADMDAMFGLQRAYASWSQSSAANLSERISQLDGTLDAMEQGLRTHFAYEEAFFLPLLGETLAKALLIEHRNVKDSIEKAKSAVEAFSPEGLSQEKLLAEKSRVQQALNDICQAVDRHATNEEIILRMMREALQAG